jgi:predicted amidohydrolase YtcJ
MRPRVVLEPRDLRGLRAPWALVDVDVWTGSGENHTAIAFGADGRVVATGTREVVLRGLGRGAQVVEGHGAFVCPGFVDPHLHVRASASASLSTDVSNARSGDQLLGAVQSATSAGGGRGRGISGGGHDWVTLTGSRLGSPPHGLAPDRRALDRVSRGIPVRIRDRGGHGWLFNSAGLRAIGIELCPTSTREWMPSGVRVERKQDGLATGFVADHVGWVGSRIGLVTEPQQMAHAVRAWSTALARLGTVAVCDATATNDAPQVEALLEWRRRRVLRQEVSYLVGPRAVPLQRRGDAPAPDPCGTGRDLGLGPRLAGVKFANARDPRLARVLRTGSNVAVHCVDVSETAAALRAAQTVPAPLRGALRLEHASHVPPDWLKIVKGLDATVVTHPSFVADRGDEYLADAALAPHEWLYRLASWTRAGVPLAFSSDAPFGPVDPLGALRAAAHRRTAAGAQLGPQEALAGEPALRAVTSTAAACSGLARLGFGRLCARGPGAAVILSNDPRDARRIDELRLIGTVMDGAVVD